MIWVLAALATFRLTRLVTTDRLLDAPREWVQARFDRLGYLVGCDWCSSVWVAPGPAVLAVFHADNPWALLVLAVPSASAVAGLLASLPDD
jgi:hypothetical protein